MQMKEVVETKENNVVYIGQEATHIFLSTRCLTGFEENCAEGCARTYQMDIVDNGTYMIWS